MIISKSQIFLEILKGALEGGWFSTHEDADVIEYAEKHTERVHGIVTKMDLNERHGKETALEKQRGPIYIVQISRTALNGSALWVNANSTYYYDAGDAGKSAEIYGKNFGSARVITLFPLVE